MSLMSSVSVTVLASELLSRIDTESILFNVSGQIFSKRDLENFRLVTDIHIENMTLE